MLVLHALDGVETEAATITRRRKKGEGGMPRERGSEERLVRARAEEEEEEEGRVLPSATAAEAGTSTDTNTHSDNRGYTANSKEGSLF